MRIATAIAVILLILPLRIGGTLMSNDSLESGSDESMDSSESTETSESSEFSTTTRPDPFTAQTQLLTPFQFIESTTPLIETKVNELSGLLKRTIHRIRQLYKKIDVVFLLDASSSVGKSSFLSELKFVRKFLSDFNVSYNYTRVSLVTFSSQGKIVSENCE